MDRRGVRTPIGAVTYWLYMFHRGHAPAAIHTLVPSVVRIGLLMFPLLAVWTIVRVVRTFLTLLEDRPITNPSYFF